MLKAVIFDIDGTLLDSVDQHTAAWQESFRHFGLDVPYARIRSEIGKGGDKLLVELLGDEQCERLKPELEPYRSNLFKKAYLDSCKPFPAVKELFEKLRAQGVKIALGSSAKKEEIEIYKKMLGIDELVDESVSSDDVENSKPDPDVVTVARKKLGSFEAPECCFVGDSPFDAAAALRDQTKMIGLLCGGFPEADLRKSGASEIFRDPADLLENWVLTLA